MRVPRLNTVTEVVREHLRESGVSDAQITAGLAQWALLPVHARGGALAAVLLQRGCELHVVLPPEKRGKGIITRAGVRAALQPVLEQYGYVTTRIVKGDGSQRLFIDRLGFKPTWSDERYTYFILTQLPFGKRN